jgi:prephenate dehydratase
VEGEISEAVVPVENSLEGAVSATLDMLAFETELLIKAELVLPIRQNLLVRKGTALKDVTRVISHPQPIGQCRRFLAEALPGAEVTYSYSTASAAGEVAGSPAVSGLAAIGSYAAAEEYGLEIIAENIQDNDNNLTRFIVMGRCDSERTGSDRTSIVFSTEDKPGSLYRILDIFNLWDINMTRIESRPSKVKLGRYVFFVDLAGHRSDEDVGSALTMVKRKSSFYKFLGSYPIMREIGI